MKNWKTTLSGIFAGGGQLLSFFGVPEPVGNAISTIGLFLIGYFAKDKNVSGGTVLQ